MARTPLDAPQRGERPVTPFQASPALSRNGKLTLNKPEHPLLHCLVTAYED